ncbi:MAG TPA: GntR family transcriptional regulator [Rhodanobacteraceae bacterium]|nr:GntR family transcriptional regulator [Rhodanobacteraceae bacterium]
MTRTAAPRTKARTPAMNLEPISHSSLQDIAYQRIRTALGGGAFKPGESLPTRTLASALGVSTTPVREALARLVAQNVLAVDPVNGTPYVPVITPDLIEEIYELRAMLEGRASECAAASITQDELAQLDAIWARLKAARSLDDQAQQSVSEEFQHAVYLAARRPVLLDLIRSVWLRSGSVLSLIAKSRPKDFSVDGYRQKLFNALKRGDAAQAGEATRAGVLATRDMLIRLMKK